MKLLLFLALVSMSATAGTIRSRKTGSTLSATCIEYYQNGKCKVYEVTAELFSGVYKKVITGPQKPRVYTKEEVKKLYSYTLGLPIEAMYIGKESLGHWAWSIPFMPVVASAGVFFDLFTLPYDLVVLIAKRVKVNKFFYIFKEREKVKNVGNNAFVEALGYVGLNK